VSLKAPSRLVIDITKETAKGNSTLPRLRTLVVAGYGDEGREDFYVRLGRQVNVEPAALPALDHLPADLVERADEVVRAAGRVLGRDRSFAAISDSVASRSSVTRISASALTWHAAKRAPAARRSVSYPSASMRPALARLASALSALRTVTMKRNVFSRRSL
jgi:hypothetical protein